MKKIFALMLVAAAGFQSYAQQLKLSSSTPVPGQPLSFVYDPSGGKLAQLTDVKCLAYTFINKRVKPVQIPLQKEGNTYKGTLAVADSTDFAMFVFRAGDTTDENPNGYYTQFYEGGKPTAMAHYWESQFWTVYGPAYAKVTTDKAKGVSSFEKAFAADPSLKNTYLNNYLVTYYAVDKPKTEQLVTEALVALRQKDQSEENLLKTASLYGIVKKRPSADSVYAIVKTKYPKGNYAFGQAANAMYAEKDIVKKEEKFNALISNFALDLNKKADAAKISPYYGIMATAFATAKNNEKFEYYTDKIESKTSRASAYNSYAWASFEAKENVPFAAKISKRSLELIEAAKKDPMPTYFSTQKEYEESLDGSYGSYADTYAALADLLGKKEEALMYQEIAVNKNKFSSAEMNERYVNLLAKNGKYPQVTKFAEQFVKDGQGTEQMKTDLKLAYKGTASFDSYYANLEKVAVEKEKAKFMKEMINMPAPKFSLVNLKGEQVDLAALKGKVVIVDYWATWCGPCIASFPGMQKAVDKYKDDPKVAFVFINTWQTEANREKVVTDWLASTKYTFNILLDNKSKDDETKFEVVDKYKVEGIPTKFIVDGNGNIRFRKEGFSGTAEAVVKELDIMIDLAKSPVKPTSK